MFKKWMDLLRRNMSGSDNIVYLGKKRVEIKKLTPNDWGSLFASIKILPGLIMQVMFTPKDDLYITLLQAIDISMDEIVKLVSIMTGIDEDYIANNVGISEIYDYLTKIAVYNEFDSIIENLKSVYTREGGTNEENNTERN